MDFFVKKTNLKFFLTMEVLRTKYVIQTTDVSLFLVGKNWEEKTLWVILRRLDWISTSPSDISYSVEKCVVEQQRTF